MNDFQNDTFRTDVATIPSHNANIFDDTWYAFGAKIYMLQSVVNKYVQINNKWVEKDQVPDMSCVWRYINTNKRYTRTPNSV